MAFVAWMRSKSLGYFPIDLTKDLHNRLYFYCIHSKTMFDFSSGFRILFLLQVALEIKPFPFVIMILYEKEYFKGK